MNSTYPFKKFLNFITITCLVTLLASCGGGGSDNNGGGASTFTIGGAVTGLSGSIVLQNNGGDSLTVNANGSFTFATGLVDGSSYLVTVSTQPVGQACNVSNGTGTVNTANVSNITINCIAISGPPVTAAMPTLGFDIKTFRFTWADVSDATFYRLMENPDGVSGFGQIGTDVASGTQSFDHIVSLYQRSNASYILQSCNSFGCTDAATTSITTTLAPAIGYFKASNTGTGDRYGISVALSADGNTLAIGARDEDSGTDTINGNEADESASNAGAVYVYTRNSGLWAKQAYIKADNSSAGDEFGTSISLSSSGDLLAVGAPRKGGDVGTVYTYTRSGGVWSQQDSFGATPSGLDFFGEEVSLSDDGSTLAVGAKTETSLATGIGSTDDNDPTPNLVGAAYIFTVSAGNWTQQEYIKADNAGPGDLFGTSVSLSSDGNTLSVGAPGEESSTNGIAMTGTGSDNALNDVGATYVFTRSGATWTQEAYIKTNSPDDSDNFGGAVSLSDDGNTLAVGTQGEDSMVNMIGGDDTDDNALQAGAAFVFSRSGTTWTQQVYVKPSNTDAGDNFGSSVSLSASGDALVVGSENEQSSAIGVNGNETDNSININNGAGAAYVFTRDITTWSQQAYIKSTNTADNDFFGAATAISGDGSTLAVGAHTEDSDSTNIGGDDTNAGSLGSGAVFLY